MTVVINGTTGIDTGTGSLISADSTTPTYLDLFEDTDNGSNYVRLIAPTSVASNRTITLPDGTGTVAVNGVSGVLVSGTAQTAPFASPNTSCDFTGIPSWVKRITVMLDIVSTNGTSAIQLQLGDSGGVETTGYVSSVSSVSNTAYGANLLTSGVPVNAGSVAAASYSGILTIVKLNGNLWSTSVSCIRTDVAVGFIAVGNKTLSDTLDRVRITTVNGTDTFDAGTINILYE